MVCGRATGAPLSPPLLLSEAYLGFNGLPFSMKVKGGSLLPPWPSWPPLQQLGREGSGRLSFFAPCLFLPSPSPSGILQCLLHPSPPLSSCLLLSLFLICVFVSTLSCLALGSCLFLSPCPGIGDSQTLQSPLECLSGPTQTRPYGTDLSLSGPWALELGSPLLRAGFLVRSV